MDNPLDSATTEQKLSILTNELRTPIEIIHGFAQVIKTNSSSQTIEQSGILQEIDHITAAADRIKNLLDDVVSSKGYYTPSNNLTSTDIILDLRQKLLLAREQNDITTLRNLAVTFDMFYDMAVKKMKQGLIIGILNNLERSAYDSIGGVPWKSIIPSEEEIISALDNY